MHTMILNQHNMQFIPLPENLRFSSHIQMVSIRQVGVERIITPSHQIWDSFFDDKEIVSDDFQRGEQIASIRESF